MFSFVDFCAGIGCGRFGLEANGFRCVGFSEIDKVTEKTYRAFFTEDETNFGDLMRVKSRDLPDFDLLIAGFPCQSFSIIGQREGMTDDRGQVILGLIRILQQKNVPYFILENVKGLISHEKGNTLKYIIRELDEAGYKVSYKVLDSVNFAIPHMRERIYFVGIRKNLVPANFMFEWPKPVDLQPLNQYLIEDDETYIFSETNKAYITFLQYLNNTYNNGLFSIEEFLQEDYLVIDTRQSDLRLYRDKVPTLRTGRHGILYVKNGQLRKLSGFEALLLQGVPLEYALKVKTSVSDTSLLSQAGNAMTVNVIDKIALKLKNTIAGLAWKKAI